MNLVVPWNRRGATKGWIKKDAVISALAEKHASLFTEVTDKVDSLHIPTR